MLNARQIQILLLLWNQDYSGDYLAKKVNSSRRTIIRDINDLNQVLSANNTATINSSGKYSLIIKNYSQFQSLINQLENQDREIIYYILVNNSQSLDELMDKTFLSKNDVLNSIERSNQRYQDILEIKSKLGIGYFIKLKFGTAIDLLAYLISVSPNNIKKSVNKKFFPDTLNSYITDHQLVAQLSALETIDPNNIKEFYQKKSILINEISFSSVQSCIERVSKHFSIKLSKQDLAGKITLHLRRYNLFPTFISNLLLKQMNDLNLKEPFAFEMAADLKDAIVIQYPNILINTDFLALYIIDCMENKESIKNVNILMFTFQRSIAYINENIISDSIQNIKITSVFNLSEFHERVKTNSYDIVITDGFSDDIRYNPDLIINGIINDTSIIRLKKLVSDNYIHNNLEQMFPKENFLSFNNKSSNYFKTIKEILKHFEDNNLIDQELSTKLYDREEEGNQLVINHVAIPHAVSNLDISRIFAVGLNKPLKLNGSEIFFLLLVIVNDKNDDYKQIFNYLYKVLNNKQIDSGDLCQTYSSVLEMFKQN